MTARKILLFAALVPLMTKRAPFLLSCLLLLFPLFLFFERSDYHGVKRSFPTQFSSHDRVHCKCGSRFKPLYRARRQENGLIELEPTGEYDIYEEIQSHRESCELTSILRRFANGETDVLSRTQGMYGDFTSFPRTYAELLNRLIEGKAMFEALPLEERQRFGNDFGLWLQSFDDVSRETSDPGPVKEIDPETMEVTSKNEP